MYKPLKIDFQVVLFTYIADQSIGKMLDTFVFRVQKGIHSSQTLLGQHIGAKFFSRIVDEGRHEINASQDEGSSLVLPEKR